MTTQHHCPMQRHNIACSAQPVGSLASLALLRRLQLTLNVRRLGGWRSGLPEAYAGHIVLASLQTSRTEEKRS